MTKCNCPASKKEPITFNFDLFEMDIYPHPFAKTGWFINLHPNKNILGGRTRYESERKAKIAFKKMLIDIRMEIDKKLKLKLLEI